MNSNIIKLLLALCVMLLIILFIEWRVSEPAVYQNIETPTSEGKPQNQPQKLAVIELSKGSVDTYSQMVDSPLFIKGRRPVIGGIEETVSQDVGRIEDLFLVGIYSVEEHLIALFNKKGPDRKYLKKAKGDDVSGWMLAEIKADKVILERDGKKQTLMLRAPKPKQPRKAKPVTRKAKPVARKKIELKS